MSAINQIAAALASARLELNDAQRESVRLAGTLDDLDSPAWAKNDAAIAAASAKIRRLESMQAAGKTFAAQDAVAKLQARRGESMNRAVKVARDRVALARRIDKAIQTVGDLLKEWDLSGAECQRHASFLHSGDMDMSWQHTMLNAARGSSARFSSALHWQLFQAGVGRTCVFIDQPLQHRQIGDPYSMEDAAAYTAEQLEAQLKRSLETLKVE